jgi:hypothetical protein
MDAKRRSLLTSVTLGLAAGASIEAHAASAPAHNGAAAQKNPSDRRMQQEIAARQIINCMNRYTTYASMGRVSSMINEFATTMKDVQADVSFGFYYGADGISRFANVNGLLMGNADHGMYLNGATNLFANTTDVVEVAEDLKTGKGLWLTAQAVTVRDPSKGFTPRFGYSRRAADFVEVDGAWRIWHYAVYGLIDMPVDKTWVDADVVTENQRNAYDWIPANLKPDLPTGSGIGAIGSWRPDRPILHIGVPVPYRTFSETFSYARTS